MHIYQKKAIESRPMMSFKLVTSICVLLVVCINFTLGAAATVRPYKFGFTIDEQQHRAEQRDERGIVMGEFGFITADGIYHVTVYATDENGKFRILSMRNYPYAGPVTPKTGQVPRTTMTTSTTTLATPLPSSPAALPKYNFNTEACSGCFLKKATPNPPIANPKTEIRTLSKPLEPSDPNTGKLPRVQSLNVQLPFQSNIRKHMDIAVATMIAVQQQHPSIKPVSGRVSSQMQHTPVRQTQLDYAVGAASKAPTQPQTSNIHQHNTPSREQSSHLSSESHTGTPTLVTVYTLSQGQELLGNNHYPHFHISTQTTQTTSTHNTLSSQKQGQSRPIVLTNQPEARKEALIDTIGVNGPIPSQKQQLLSNNQHEQQQKQAQKLHQQEQPQKQQYQLQQQEKQTQQKQYELQEQEQPQKQQYQLQQQQKQYELQRQDQQPQQKLYELKQQEQQPQQKQYQLQKQQEQQQQRKEYQFQQQPQHVQQQPQQQQDLHQQQQPQQQQYQSQQQEEQAQQKQDELQHQEQQPQQKQYQLQKQQEQQPQQKQYQLQKQQEQQFQQQPQHVQQQPQQQQQQDLHQQQQPQQQQYQSQQQEQQKIQQTPEQTHQPHEQQQQQQQQQQFISKQANKQKQSQIAQTPSRDEGKQHLQFQLPILGAGADATDQGLRQVNKNLNDKQKQAPTLSTLTLHTPTQGQQNQVFRNPNAVPPLTPHSSIDVGKTGTVSSINTAINTNPKTSITGASVSPAFGNRDPSPATGLSNGQNTGIDSNKAGSGLNRGFNVGSGPTPALGSTSGSGLGAGSFPSKSGEVGDLYKFKYILDYNGHEEKGDRAGNKEGNYFSIGEDTVQRTIEYIANEFGFQPHVSWRKLDVNAAALPPENTLKEYEFKWFNKAE